MKSSFMSAAVFAAIGALAGPQTAWAQTPALPVVSTPDASQNTMTTRQLDQLVAPVALYPDQVLTDILAASTYPAEVVEAERFAADPAHAGMDAASLSGAAAGEDWDPSVKALLMFPQVLQMMDSNLNWTEHLGRAFVAQQADVMAAVQHLRLEAEQAGTLESSPNETVVNEGDDILIEPPSGQDIYLPSYQAQCVYGPDPACDGLDNQVFWASDIFLPYGYLQWGSLDWNRRDIRLNRPTANAELTSRGAGDLGNVWHPGSLRGASFGNSITGNPGGFNYAPPANAPFSQQNDYARGGGFARPNFVASLAHFNGAQNGGARSAGGQGRRPMVQRAPVFTAPRAAGAAHASGGGHR